MCNSHSKWKVQCIARSNLWDAKRNVTTGAAGVTFQHHKIFRLLPKVTHEPSSTVRGATGVTLQHHKILPLPQNREFKIWPRNMSIASAKRETIWRYSEENPRRVRPWTGDSHLPVRRAYSNQCNFTKYCACQEKWHCNFTNSVPASKKLHSSIVATSPNMLLPRKVTLQLH